MKLSKEKRVKKKTRFEAYRVRRLLERLIDIPMFGFTYVNYQQDTEKLFRKCKTLLETLQVSQCKLISFFQEVTLKSNTVFPINFRSRINYKNISSNTRPGKLLFQFYRLGH